MWKISEVISPLIIGVCFLVTSFSVYSFKAQLCLLASVFFNFCL